MPHRHIETFKDCPDCQKMVKMGAGIRLLDHLQRFHRHNEDVAHAFVNWVFGRLSEVRRKIAEKISQSEY